MGLKHISPPQVRRVTASIFTLALVIQSFYGIFHPMNAFAASATTVSPDAMHEWQTNDEEVGDNSSVDFVNTRGTAGSGSAQFTVKSIEEPRSLSLPVASQTLLTDISAMSYDSYITSGVSAAPQLQMTLDTDVTDGSSAQSQLNYSPYKNGSIVIDEWQHHDARDGVWWFSDPTSFSGLCPVTNPCSLDSIITLYPNAGIVTGSEIGFSVVGSEVDPSVASVDNFSFNTDIYNFEAIGAPQLLEPANAASVPAPTVLSTWQAVPLASKYIYESYNDEAATQRRVCVPTTETQNTETDLVKGTTLWWRVKTVDAQGNKGNWSELRKVTVIAEAKSQEVVGGAVSGEGGKRTEELLVQLARLNEPFVLPDPAAVAFATSDVVATVNGLTDTSDLPAEATNSSEASQNLESGIVTPTESGWRFFGVLWYWWILIFVALGFVIVPTMQLVRSTRTFLYTSDQI